MAAVGFAGCYTQLMPIREAVAIRKASKEAVHTRTGGGGSDLDYRGNCLSCHTQAELNDRAFDMDYAGLYTVHGISYDPYGWQNPYAQPPWWNPFPEVYYAPSDDGVVPVIITGGGASSGSGSAPATRATRTRSNAGSSRDNGRTRSASPTTTSASPTPSGSTNSSGSSSSSAPVQTPTVSTPPAQTQSTPPSQQTETRTNSGGSEQSHTRHSGSGR